MSSKIPHRVSLGTFTKGHRKSKVGHGPMRHALKVHGKSRRG